MTGVANAPVAALVATPAYRAPESILGSRRVRRALSCWLL
jgi:hypothetical protein